MTLEFPKWVEDIYKTLLNLNILITIPTHLLIILLAIYRTPKEMKPYRYTVTNTTVWSILFTIHSMYFFQPMPLFPLPAVKVLGITASMGDYYGGHIQFMIMIILAVNEYVAQFICFINLYLTLCHWDFHTKIKLVHGITIYAVAHIFATAACVFVILNAYTPAHEIKEGVLRMYPHLEGVMNHKDMIFFGFDMKNWYTGLMIQLGWLLFALKAVFVPLGLLRIYLILLMLGKLHAQTTKFKKMVWRKMLFRATAPIIWGLIPTALCFWIAQSWPFQSYMIGNCLMLIMFSHGFWISFSTIMSFNPFRKALRELFKTPKSFFNASIISTTSKNRIHSKTQTF